MDKQTIIISVPLVISLLNNEQFYLTMPEFLQLKPKLQTMGLSATTLTSNCSTCTQKRIHATILKDFLILLQALPEEGLRRFKEFLGVKNIMINTSSDGMQNQIKIL